MPVFLNQERTKIGTTTGTLIAFPQELEVNDPAVGNSLTLLPSGYLRCDGKIYNESVYPALAEVIGTGDSCAFKQTGVTLSDTQFQVPDLRSKFIKASSASDQGVINDISVLNASGQTVERSGVGVNVSSNVGSVATVDMTGQFRVPPRTVTLTGNLGFTRPRSPDEEIIPINGFSPHAHYSTTFRSRTIRRGGSNVFELNYYTNASTIGIQNWFDATNNTNNPKVSGSGARQDACYHYAHSVAWNNGAFSASGTFLGVGADWFYYGICKGSCGLFTRNCLIPTGRSLNITVQPEGPCIQRYRIFFITYEVEMPCVSLVENVPENYTEGAQGVGNDNIPTAAATSGGVFQSFSLHEDLDGYASTPGYVQKGLGQWSYTSYGTEGTTMWSTLGDFFSGEVNMVGGSGTSLRLAVRFEAWPGTGGAPVNTRYKIVGVIDGGTDYAAGDVLTFPDAGGYPLSAGSSQLKLEINSTSFGANVQDAAAYPHNTSLHDVLPVDTVVDNNNSAVYPQVSNIVETTEPFDYDSDPTEHTHTINYTTGLTNYEIDIPETFISTDGMNASININAETDTKIDNLIQPFIMVDYLIKI